MKIKIAALFIATALIGSAAAMPTSTPRSQKKPQEQVNKKKPKMDKVERVPRSFVSNLVPSHVIEVTPGFVFGKETQEESHRNQTTNTTGGTNKSSSEITDQEDDKKISSTKGLEKRKEPPKFIQKYLSIAALKEIGF